MQLQATPSSALPSIALLYERKAQRTRCTWNDRGQATADLASINRDTSALAAVDRAALL